MKNMKRVAKTVGTLGLVGCAVLSTQFAVAADSGWIGGFNFGQARANIDDERIAAQLQAAGFTSSTMRSDNQEAAYKIFGGYKFNKNFAIEGGYFNLGKYSYAATTVPAGTLSGEIKLQGLNLDLVGIWPFTVKFSAFGRVGVNYAEAKDHFVSAGAVTTPTDPNPSKNSANYKVGLGLQYDFTRSVGLRGEWERYRINDAVGNDGDVNMYSLGVVVMFGGSEPPPRAVTRVIVPVRAQKQYCSVLDVEYTINRDEIQLEEEEKLRTVAAFLQKYPDTTAVIEGHTDNVGTSENNLQLSRRRAQNVVTHMVDHYKIDSSRLTAVGYGEERPMADNDTDAGRRMNRRINAVIACATDFEGLKVVRARTTIAMEMEFDPYSDDIKPQYRDELRKVANFMKANPSVAATVEGHAGKYAGTKQLTPELSMEISQRRATHVVKHLVDDFGIARSRLSTEAFGQTHRVSYGTSLEGQQENRRVNIVINYDR